MKTSAKMMMASAVVGCGFAAAVGPASAAYSFSPPSTLLTGTNLNNQTFKIGATGATVSCSTATFSGVTPASGPETSFTAAFSGTGSAGSCPAGAWGNVKVAVSGPWTLTITGGSGPYTGFVSIPSGSTVTTKPLTVPTCTITFSSTGNSHITGISAVNTTPTGVRLYGAASGITYSASSGCPGIPPGTRSDAVYDTGGTVTSGGIAVPGMTILGP